MFSLMCIFLNYVCVYTVSVQVKARGSQISCVFLNQFPLYFCIVAVKIFFTYNIFYSCSLPPPAPPRSTSSFLRQVFSLNLELMIQRDQADRELLGFSCFCLQGLGLHTPKATQRPLFWSQGSTHRSSSRHNKHFNPLSHLSRPLNP